MKILILLFLLQTHAVYGLDEPVVPLDSTQTKKPCQDPTKLPKDLLEAYIELKEAFKDEPLITIGVLCE